MKYEISVSEDRTYIKVTVYGDITAELQKEFAGNAIRKSQEHNIINFLVDVSQVINTASVLDNYRFAHGDMMRFGQPRAAKIAVLVAPHDSSHNFVETVFKNAGYNFRLFKEKGEALAWFRE